MDGPVSGITVVSVLHASRVAAIDSAAGPRRLLDAGLVERLEGSGLPVEVEEVEGPEGETLGEVGASFGVADAVARRLRKARDAGRLGLVLSGSCHVGLGSLAGTDGRRRGVVWLDCHGDFNTPETTGSGLLDGTTLATVTGRCWRRMASGISGFSPVEDEDVLLLGARSLDPGEAGLLEASGVTAIPGREVTARAPGALADLGGRVGGVYVHVDLDVLDSSVGRANAYAEEGGLSRQGLVDVVGGVMDRCPVRVVGFASYDPAADEGDGVLEAALEVAARIGERAAASG